MKFLDSDHVLCIGAHPDDVEYGMAGTFEKCNETEFTVFVMSDGGDFDNTTKSFDLSLNWAKGSSLWASNPADNKINSGLNSLSFLKILS